MPRSGKMQRPARVVETGRFNIQYWTLQLFNLESDNSPGRRLCATHGLSVGVYVLFCRRLSPLQCALESMGGMIQVSQVQQGGHFIVFAPFRSGSSSFDSSRRMQASRIDCAWVYVLCFHRLKCWRNWTKSGTPSNTQVASAT